MSKNGMASVTERFVQEKYGLYSGWVASAPYRGQPWQVVAFHLLARQGLADRVEAGGKRYYFDITPSDRATYDLPPSIRQVILEVRSEDEIQMRCEQ